MSALLRLDGLEAGYGDLTAVSGVSLEVRRGEAVALIGSNGAGKTTTLRAICGLLPVRAGRIEFEGPRLLLLDEPSLGLAPMTVKLIFDTLRRVNGDGTTIMLVEQNVPRAIQLSHRGYVLENGRIVLEGTRESLRASPHVKQAYLGL